MFNRNLFKITSTFIFVTLLSSCSLIKKAVIAPTGMLIYDASFDQQIENDWEMFEKSLYGNIKLLESLLSQDESNKNLLASLTKAYAAKGFAIDETYYLADHFAEKEKSIHLEAALISYTKAMQYGLRYLEAEGIPADVLSNQVNTPDKFKEYLDSELSYSLRNKEVVLYLAQSLGSLVNLQRTNMKIISYLPLAKSMFDWVCADDPDFNFGTCDIFYASYDAGRPKMLGGNPENGKRRFIDGIKKYPENYLLRISYVQYFAIPMMEEDIYNEQVNSIEKFEEKFEDQKYWQGEKITLPSKNYLNVFNLIALKRKNIIKKFEKNIF